MGRLVVLSVVVAGLLAACAASGLTASRTATSTPSLPITIPTRTPTPMLFPFLRLDVEPSTPGPTDTPYPTPYPFTPFPLEPLPPYPTPVRYWSGTDVALMQTLPTGVTPPVPAEDRSLRARAICPYFLVAQKQIGRYFVREWEASCQGWGIATFSTASEILAQIEFFRGGVRHAGRDITGEGHPDVVVGTTDVGASMMHTSVKVYDLGPTVTQVMDTPFVSSDPVYYVPCPWYGEFADLDSDGSAEFATCDDAPRYGYYSSSDINPYAEHRQMEVTAVLAYEPGHGYVPASPRFANLYAGYIDMYTRQAEEQAARESRDETHTRIDPLLELTLNYLYSGQPAKAWAELDRLHHGPDKVFLWSTILRIASDSPFYTPAGSFPDVPVPDYYALQLAEGCGPDSDCPTTVEEGQPTCTPREFLTGLFARSVGWPVFIVEEGQRAGDPAFSVRTISWLEDELAQLGVLSWKETLEVSRSEGTPCRLDIVRDGKLRGHIELDMSGGFPGEVRRVDRKGRQRASWRLRGDLTWEEVPP
jgi:hypothetical protein